MPKPRVLVVDDNRDALQMLEALLVSDGLDVVATDSARDGLRLISNRIDAVVTDLAMPGMDGFEFVRRLRSRGSESKIPVVVVTGQPTDVLGISAQQLDACLVLMKPCAPADLIEALRRSLKHCDGGCATCAIRS